MVAEEIRSAVLEDVFVVLVAAAALRLGAPKRSPAEPQPVPDNKTNAA